MQVAERLPHRGSGRDDITLPIYPRAQGREHRLAVLQPAGVPLLRSITCECRLALDREQRLNEAQPLDGEQIAPARGFYEPSASMTPTPWACASGTLDESGDAGPVALHGAFQVLTKKAAHAI